MVSLSRMLTSKKL